MNTTTQTTDERCAELAGKAVSHCKLAMWKRERRRYRALGHHYFMVPAFADRIIALRAFDLAQAVQS